MSVDLVELGKDIGEAQATADAALETAQIAEVEATIAVVEESSDASHDSEATAHCGPDCPCHAHSRELEAMLVALSDKHDEDMDVIARALDYLLGEEADEAGDEGTVEMIEEEEAHGSDATTDQPGAEGHAAAGTSGDGAAEAEDEAEEKHEHRHTTAARRTGFKRGRR